MIKAGTAVRIVSVSLMILGAGVVSGQDYPNKPVRIVTGAAGGGADFGARIIASGIAGPLGQPVVVDNRPVGVIPGQVVMQSPPDGYTLLYAASSLWLGQYLQQSTPYDVIKDFVPVTLATSSPTVLVVHPSLPVKSVKDLIALAKSKPGALNYASGATGSANHLTAELFKSMAKVDIVRIAYKGGGPAITDLMAGQTQLMFAVTGSVIAQIKAGRLKALAVTSAQPTELVPGLPTVAATGLPGFESVANNGVFAPARTPKPIIDRLNQEIVRALARSDVKEKFLNSGVDPVGSTPTQLETAVKAEMEKMGKVIKDAGIREE